MKDAVLIKSYQSGITLLMREDASLEEILQELAGKISVEADQKVDSCLWKIQ